jgi:uncharacterized membrane protein (UPF0127 family)
MKFQRLFWLLLIAPVFWTGCKKTEKVENSTPIFEVDVSEPQHAQPKLPTIKLWVGAQEMNSEMAVTPRQVQTGMMFRKTMGEDESMIFVLPYPQQANFWMKNCSVPLSVAYIDPQGVIAEIHHLEPFNTNSVTSASQDILFALETPQGWFKRHDVHPGMTIRTERGSLAETFGKNPR